MDTIIVHKRKSGARRSSLLTILSTLHFVEKKIDIEEYNKYTNTNLDELEKYLIDNHNLTIVTPDTEFNNEKGRRSIIHEVLLLDNNEY